MRAVTLTISVVLLGVGVFGCSDRPSGEPADTGVKDGDKPSADQRSPVPEPGADLESITNSIGMKLKLIPAGEFLMGSPDSDEDADDDERPQHRVRITQAFYLDQYEVTQGQFEQIMGRNPSRGKKDPRRPVECVSWFDAVQFCNRLSEKEDLSPYYQLSDVVRARDIMPRFSEAIHSATVAVPGGSGYRLPTEAEWEYACRAGTTTRYYFGDSPAELDRYAWHYQNADKSSQRVGKKGPNAFGLFDMPGNVSEWCGDWLDKEYYGKSPPEDPEGPPSGETRVHRGSSFAFDPADMRAAARDWLAPSMWVNVVGFRVARTPQP